jgi:hypothetical protein
MPTDDSMELPVAISMVGADNQRELKDVALKPGTRSIDIVADPDLDLAGYSIRKPDGTGQFFGPQDDVFVAVLQAGVSKLEAVPGMTVSTLAAA